MGGGPARLGMDQVSSRGGLWREEVLEVPDGNCFLGMRCPGLQGGAVILGARRMAAFRGVRRRDGG